MSGKNKQCAVLFILGQSNAHAHCQGMREEDIIKEPLKNVFKLDPKDNLSFDNDSVVWSNFSSYGYNVAETQDCTYSMASYVARMWQEKIDKGEDLPDLYIIQESIGGQMIIGGMWDPNYPLPKVCRGGTYVVCEIALYNFAMHLFPLVYKDLCAKYDSFIHLGMHWLGSEGDTFPGTYDRKDFHDIYFNFFNNLRNATGFDLPLYLYKIVRYKNMEKKGQATDGIDAVNAEFEKLTTLINKTYTVDPRNAELFDPSLENDGLFSDDLSHYRFTTQKWFAENALKTASII